MDRIHKRREGPVSISESTDGNKSNNQHNDKNGEGGFDE